MTKLYANPIFQESRIDLLVGGTPCQSFSVAGLRQGLSDPRGNLCLEFLRLVDVKRPRWFVWENVPGVLSSGKGRDFGSFLGAIQQLGYGFAYRILDAQYFGVPQRRRRVFVVGYLGDWRPAAAVLFEPESLLGHIKARRKTRQGTSEPIKEGIGGGGKPVDFRNLRFGEDELCGTLQAKKTGGYSLNYSTGVLTGISNYKDKENPTLGASGGDCGGGSECIITTYDRQSTGEYGEDTVDATVSARDYKSASDLITCIPFDTTQVTSPLNYSNPKSGDNCHPLASGAHPPAIAFNWMENLSFKAEEEEVTNPLRVSQTEAVCVTGTKTHTHTLKAEGFDASEDGTGRGQPITACFGVSGCETPKVGNNVNPNLRSERQGFISYKSCVRRLTPRECERLQGFPDDYTLIVTGKKASDGPRYKALGNSMAVPVMRWIGQRIQTVDNIIKWKEENAKEIGKVSQ